MKTQQLIPYNVDEHSSKVSYETTNSVLQVSINSGTSPMHTFFLYFQKLTWGTSALELVKWTDHHEKGRAAEVLVMAAMKMTKMAILRLLSMP